MKSRLCWRGVAFCAGVVVALSASCAAPAPSDNANTNQNDNSSNGNQSDCTAASPRIGETAELTTRAHGVSGTARILDDCTIVIENFTYDGAGVDVRVYGGLDLTFQRFVALSGDLLRSGGYNNERLELTLPEDATLDDIRTISIWCVPVGVSFGDGTFQ